MDNEFRIELSAGLNTQSKNQVISEIDDIKERVKDLEINLKIDPKVAKNLVGQLDTLKVSLTDVNLSPKTLNTLVTQINSALNSVDFGNLNFNGNQLQQQARQTGQQIGKIISDSAEQSINRVTSDRIGKYFKVTPTTSNQFRSEMKKLVDEWTKGKGSLKDIKIDTRTVYDKDTDESFEKLHQAHVTYVNDLNEVIKKTVAWRQIGTTQNQKGEDEAIMGFVEVASQYSKSLDKISAKTDTFSEKQKKAVANLKNQLNQIYKSSTDPNAPRPIKESGHLSSLESEYNKITAAINNLGNASSNTFTDEQNSAKTLISNLKSMVSEYKNAENVASKMKGTNISSGIKIAKNDLEKLRSDAKDFPNFISTIEKLEASIKSVGDASSLNAFNDQLRVARSELAKVKSETNAINRESKVGINISGLQSKIDDLKRISPEIENFKASINGTDVSVQSLSNDLANVKTQSDFSVVNTKFRAFVDSAKAAGIAVTEVAAKTKSITEQSKNIQLNIETGSYEAKVESLVSRTRQWIDENGNARISTENLSKALKDLNTANSELAKSGGNTIANQEKLIEAEQKLDAELNKVRNEITKTNAEFAKTSAVDNLKQKVQQFYDINTKSHLKYGSQLKQIMSELGQGAEVPITKLKELEKRFINIQNVARVTGRLGKSFFDQIKSGIQSFIPWLSTTHLVMKGIHSIREGISTVKELDYALVDLRKTTKMSTSQLEDFYYASNEVAKQMGVTTQQILEQSSAWSRLGFNTAEQATKMAKYSSMFATISPGMDIDSATDGLVSVMKAFKIGAEDVDDVVDGIMSKINIIGNTRAVNNTDIVNFLTKSSAAMAEANNTLEDTIALGTAITEITRDAANAGQVMKTASMRIRGRQSLPPYGESYMLCA